MKPSQPEPVMNMASVSAAPVTAVAPAQLQPQSQPQAISGPQPAIHLASYRSVKQAERGWSQLKRAHQGILTDLNHTIMEINLGTKGIYYRLIAGPYNSGAQAKDVCRQLKSRRQFCDPTFAEFG
jgi:hypothetical protein